MPECAGGAVSHPVLNDAAFRSAALACAAAIETATELGIAGGRLAKAVRAWVEGNDPAAARTVAMAAGAACRMSKMRAGRAA
jgi:hypothetical protein